MVLFSVVNWKIGRSEVYFCSSVVSFLAVLFPFFIFFPVFFPFLLFFPVFNVARFVTSGYMDKRFIVLCNSYLPSKTDSEKFLSVVGGCSQIFLPLVFIYPQPMKFRVALFRGVKRLPWRSTLRMISYMYIWTHIIFYKEQKYLVVLIYLWV